MKQVVSQNKVYVTNKNIIFDVEPKTTGFLSICGIVLNVQCVRIEQTNKQKP